LATSWSALPEQWPAAAGPKLCSLSARVEKGDPSINRCHRFHNGL